MASITVGTGATIKSATAEGQLHELCAYLQIGELSISNNPDGADNIVGTHAQNASTFTASYSIPTQQNINDNGQIMYSATDYLTGLNFSPGTGGTFRSATAAGYFMEVVIYLQNLERVEAKNPQKRNNITGTFNSDSTLFSGTINLPVAVTVDNSGQVVYAAEEYLLA